MQIDDNLLSKLEKLSALEFSSDQRQELLAQLNEIVGFVENLNELDLSHSQAQVNIIENATPFREDIVKENSVIHTVFEHAPSSQDGFFIVPKIIE